MAKTFIGKMGPKNLLRAVFIIYAVIGITAFTAIGLVIKYAVTSAENKNYSKALQNTILVYNDADSSDTGSSQPEEAAEPVADAGENVITERIPEAIDFATLKAISENAVAWLYQPGTGINYSVAQGTDNEYYLDHMLDGSRNDAGNLFVDYRNEKPFADLLTFVYGHNMKNGTMFGMLNRYAKQSFYDEHPKLYLYTEYERRELVVLAGMKVEPDSSVYSLLESKADQRSLISEFFAGSTFTCSKEAAIGADEKGDLLKLVILSTCSGNNSGKRYVLLTYIK